VSSPRKDENAKVRALRIKTGTGDRRGHCKKLLEISKAGKTSGQQNKTKKNKNPHQKKRNTTPQKGKGIGKKCAIKDFLQACAKKGPTASDLKTPFCP